MGQLMVKASKMRELRDQVDELVDDAETFNWWEFIGMLTVALVAVAVMAKMAGLLVDSDGG